MSHVLTFFGVKELLVCNVCVFFGDIWGCFAIFCDMCNTAMSRALFEKKITVAILILRYCQSLNASASRVNKVNDQMGKNDTYCRLKNIAGPFKNRY